MITHKKAALHDVRRLLCYFYNLLIDEFLFELIHRIFATASFKGVVT